MDLKDPDGSVERYKARLVGRGFTQEHVIDYDEIFAFVAQMTTIHTLLAVPAVRHWPLYQMDVKNAFLYSSLTEDVYMQPPPGLTTPPNHVCHLRRAIYGLKQAPRAWFECFRRALTTFGFQQSTVAGFQDNLYDHSQDRFQESFQDQSLFVRTSPQGCVLLLFYVDDR